MIGDFQQCPRCGGAINREHFAREPLPHDRKEITLLYCAYCDFGIETLWSVTDDRHSEEFSLEFDPRKDPVELGKFLQRLHDRRAA
jgi:hypothetical protein